MIFTYGQGIMILGFSLIFGPLFEAFESNTLLSRRVKLCGISMLNIVPGIIVFIVGIIIYVIEFSRYLLMM